MNMPYQILVGWKIYRVEVWNHELAEAHHKYGECDHVAGVIRIDLHYGHRQAAETLMHEILHAIYCVGCLVAQREVTEPMNVSEEHVVSYTASWLAAVMVANPALLAYLTFAFTGD